MREADSVRVVGSAHSFNHLSDVPGGTMVRCSRHARQTAVIRMTLLTTERLFWRAKTAKPESASGFLL